MWATFLTRSPDGTTLLWPLLCYYSHSLLLIQVVTHTMPMTMRRSACLCLMGTFCRMSQPVSWSSLNATAKWWFSSTDSSLYISANSDPVSTHRYIYSVELRHRITSRSTHAGVLHARPLQVYSNVNATTKWRFSSTDSSLYISANSDPVPTHLYIYNVKLLQGVMSQSSPYLSPLSSTISPIILPFSPILYANHKFNI